MRAIAGERQRVLRDALEVLTSRAYGPAEVEPPRVAVGVVADRHSIVEAEERGCGVAEWTMPVARIVMLGGWRAEPARRAP